MPHFNAHFIASSYMYKKNRRISKNKMKKSSKKFRAVSGFLHIMDENVKRNMFFKVQSCNCLEHNAGNSLQT